MINNLNRYNKVMENVHCSSKDSVLQQLFVIVLWLYVVFIYDSLWTSVAGTREMYVCICFHACLYMRSVCVMCNNSIYSPFLTVHMVSELCQLLYHTE